MGRDNYLDIDDYRRWKGNGWKGTGTGGGGKNRFSPSPARTPPGAHHRRDGQVLILRRLQHHRPFSSHAKKVPLSPSPLITTPISISTSTPEAILSATLIPLLRAPVAGSRLDAITMQAMPDARQQSFEEIYGPPENFLEIEVCSSLSKHSP